MNIFSKYISHITLYGISIGFIFLLFVILRGYQFESRSQFTYDQVDNAWVSKNLIIDHKYPLVGMTARQSSGVSIGPLYYYYIAFFYWLTNLDPIASPIAAIVASILTFFAFYYIARNIFGRGIALVSLLLYSVASYIIYFDRIQWPVDFVPLFSLLIFYSLYKLLLGEEKYLLFLGLFIGLSFHIHSTSLYYLLIIFFTLPLFPRTRKTILYAFGATFLFLACLLPNIINSFQNKYYTSGIINFLKSSYLGIHGRRILQVAPSAFIEFEKILYIKIISIAKYIVLPLYIFIELYKDKNREVIVRVYLITLWFLIPWFGFSVYKGDISDYFLALTRPFAVIIISSLLVKLYQLPNLIPKFGITFLVIVFAVINICAYNSNRIQGLDFFKKKGLLQVSQSRGNEFTYGAAESYMYYFYSRKLYHLK